MDEVDKNFNMDISIVEAVLPIGAVMCSTGKIVSTASLAVYATLIYSVELNLTSIFIILFTSILYSIAINGIPGAISATMLGIVLQPLGIPIDLVSVILIATLPLYQGISTFSRIYSNLAVVSLLSPCEKSNFNTAAIIGSHK